MQIVNIADFQSPTQNEADKCQTRFQDKSCRCRLLYWGFLSYSSIIEKSLKGKTILSLLLNRNLVWYHIQVCQGLKRMKQFFAVITACVVVMGEWFVQMFVHSFVSKNIMACQRQNVFIKLYIDETEFRYVDSGLSQGYS